MKITKTKKCNSAKTIDEAVTQIDSEPIYDEVDEDKCKECACDNIMSAIHSLGSIANINSSAREAIANLSVVYFDLK